MTRVAVLATDGIGPLMTSSGIRSFELARALARTLDVTLFVPDEPAGVRPGDAAVERIDLFSSRQAADLARTFGAVVAQPLPVRTARRLAASGTRIVYDMYIPSGAEWTAVARDRTGRGARLLAAAGALATESALRTGSAFICANTRQRDFWLSALRRLGRIDSVEEDGRLGDVIDVVPFGIPEEDPGAEILAIKGVVRGIAPGDRVLLWAGGIVDWLDPLTVIRAVARIAARRSDVKLFFLAVEPPRAAVPEMAGRAVDLARSLGVLDSAVFFNRSWIAYDERARYLLDADLGVCAHFDTLETHLAARTRLLDHFWAGLPTVSTRGDVLAELVESRGLGRTVEFGDVDGWAAAVEPLLDDEGERDRIRARLDAVRGELRWSKVVCPLARLAQLPRGLPSAPTDGLEARAWWLRAQLAAHRRLTSWTAR